MIAPATIGPIATDTLMTRPNSANARARAGPAKYSWIMPMICGL